MVLIYVGEVGNGGHLQFFSNQGGEITTRVQWALRDIGLVELEAILANACALFPGVQVPADRAQVIRLLDEWSEERLAELDLLDRRVWRLDAVPRLMAYLRENDNEVLRPERGLGEAG